MNGSWRRFLERQGASIDSTEGAARVTAFGDPTGESAAVVSGDALAPLAEFSLVRIDGLDAGSFLQGQFTNDVAAISREGHALGSYCSVKGRVIATFRMFRRDEAWILVMPAPIVKRVVERLRLYRVAARVEIEPQESVVGIGIAGARGEALCLEHAGLGSLAPGRAVSVGPLTLLSEEVCRPRLLAFGTVEAVAGLWEVAGDVSKRCGEDAWSLLDVRSLIPYLRPETSEAFLPQMLGLAELGAVSFEKGCFPGQEVVARTQHLGQVKRTLRRGRLAGGSALPRPGTALRALAAGRETDAGTVIAAARAEEGRAELLAVVSRAAEAADEIRAGDASGPRMELLDAAS